MTVEGVWRGWGVGKKLDSQPFRLRMTVESLVCHRYSSFFYALFHHALYASI